MSPDPRQGFALPLRIGTGTKLTEVFEQAKEPNDIEITITGFLLDEERDEHGQLKKTPVHIPLPHINIEIF